MSGTDYKLVVLSRDVDILGPNPKHTGYALVKFENNVPIAMKTIEVEGTLIPPSVMQLVQSNSSKIALEGGWLPINNELSTETIFVPQQVYEKGEWINTTAEWVKDREFVTKEIHSNKISNPFNTYNEILLMADLFDTFAKNGLKITYDVLFQNCNTWTSFINKEYFDDVDVFSLFDDIGYIGSDVPILFMKMNILEKYIENSIIEYYEISIFKLLERIAVYLIQNSIDFSSTVLTIKKYLSGITCILTSEVGKTIFEEKHPFFPSLKDLITETTEKVDTASETRSPLAIDLDGNGVETISVDNGICFNDKRTKYNYRFTHIFF